jgi:hypothetical protein
VADQAVDKVIDNEAKALKSAEAAFEAASVELAKPVKAAVEAPAKTVEAVAKAAPAPVKAAPAAKVPAKAKAKPVRKAAAKRSAKPVAKAQPAKAPKTINLRKSNKKAPVRKAAAATNQGVKIMANTNTKTAENIFGADRFQAAFGEINERAKAATEKTAKIAEELTDLTRGNVEAIVASSKVAQKGLETLGQTAADFGRKSFEDAQNAFKSFGEIRSATDFFKLQGDFARGAFDAAIAESARVSEAMLKIANDAAEPLTSRYTVAAERVKTLAAA